jgi:hypothetical protein
LYKTGVRDRHWLPVRVVLGTGSTTWYSLLQAQLKYNPVEHGDNPLLQVRTAVLLVAPVPLERRKTATRVPVQRRLFSGPIKYLKQFRNRLTIGTNTLAVTVVDATFSSRGYSDAKRYQALHRNGSCTYVLCPKRVLPVGLVPGASPK